MRGSCHSGRGSADWFRVLPGLLSLLAGYLWVSIMAARPRVLSMVLAGGEGRRLLPLTLDRAKPAVPFGGIEGEKAGGDAAGEDRTDDLRTAFNSPFWPHVLATTSVGQEGLDFHSWCSRVGHWDLPSSPLDLEQREGRVQRFAGLAIRRALAQAEGAFAIAEVRRMHESLWCRIEAAADLRHADPTGLSPCASSRSKGSSTHRVVSLVARASRAAASACFCDGSEPAGRGRASSRASSRASRRSTSSAGRRS